MISAATFFFFLLGLVFLAVGAEFLVRGASRLAVALGISPLIVGLTVVAYCTSAPELAVSISSASAGQTDLAVGNVIGSNIFNILFILGLSSLLVPLVVSGQLIRLDVPVMLAASIVVFAMAFDGAISRADGLILLAGMITYTAVLVVMSRRERETVRREFESEYGEHRPPRLRDHVLHVGLLIAGLGILVVGAQWLVESATVFARALGVSELIIGLTVVALGTSLPEVAASVVASLRRERDIAVGNVIGSNISNLLLVLGLAAIVAPDGLPVPRAAVTFDLPVMLAAAIACLPIFFTGRMIARWEGALFLMFYFLFITYVILAATEPTILSLFQAALVFFVIPLTIITLVATSLRALRSQRNSK